MKKILYGLFILVLIGITIPILQAADTTPTGKNMLNPNLFYVDSGGMYTYQSIPVAGDTRYVFSMPSDQHVGEMHILIRDEHKTYVNEINTQGSSCNIENDLLVCVFQTDVETEALEFVLSSHQSAFFTYHQNFGFYNYQLEKGTSVTAYEPYTGEIQDSIPVIQGDGNLFTSYESALTMDYIIGNYITAYDEIDGDLTEDIIIVSDPYTGNEQVVGTYTVDLEVSDSSHNTAVFTLYIHVQDEVPPEISGPSYFEVDVDAGNTIDDLVTAYLTLYDEYDGVIDTYRIVEDGYTENKRVLNQHPVKIEIEDSSGNKATHSFAIEVKDYTAPEITGRTSTVLLQSEENALEDILLGLGATDNHTPDDEILFGIYDHNLPECMDIPGVYEVVLEAIDASENRTTKVHEVTIYDDVPPVIEGPITYEVSYQDIVTIDTLKDLLTVSDNSAPLTREDLYVVENSYQGHHEEPGIYRIIFAVEDENNITEHAIYIQVVDDVPPVFEVAPRIVIEKGSTVAAQDMLMLLMQHETIHQFNPTDLKIIDKEQIGTDQYIYTVELTNEAEETVESSLEILYVSHELEASNDYTDLWIIGSSFIIVFSIIIVIRKRI